MNQREAGGTKISSLGVANAGARHVRGSGQTAADSLTTGLLFSKGAPHQRDLIFARSGTWSVAVVAALISVVSKDLGILNTLPSGEIYRACGLTHPGPPRLHHCAKPTVHSLSTPHLT